MRRVLGAALLCALARPAPAQSNTDQLLAQAVRYHEALDVERELIILRRVISPNSPFVVTHDQRVRAYKYLGAALVVLGQPDSGIVYFRAALERDPFVDLEPQRFTPAELAAFGQAKRLTFGLGVRTIAVDTIDPRTQRIGFTVVTTHPADLRVMVRSAGAATGLTLYEGGNDGPRELQWDGLLSDGHLVTRGRYELVVAGVSRITQRGDSARMYFSIQPDHSPLEDTLADLRPADLLPEKHPRAYARGELVKGFGIAAAAMLIPPALANSDLEGGGKNLAIGIAITASAVGVGGFIYRQQHREIPANIAANAQRRAERATVNAAIRVRNRARLEAARLIIAPAAGVGPPP